MKIVLPMAAEDSTKYENGKVTSEKVGDAQYVMQPKLDGSRYIAQWDEDGKFSLTSRHISVKTGLPVDKTEHGKKLFFFRDNKNLAGTIIDGEVICYNDNEYGLGMTYGKSQSSLVNKVMLTKADSLDSLIDEFDKGNGVRKYIAYDILSYGNSDTQDIVFEHRNRVFLTAAIKTIKDELCGVLEQVVTYPNTDENLSKLLVHEGYEGVMLKHTQGKYEQGKRSKNWLKVKKLITEDAIVLGGVEGNGKYQGTLGALIIGQYVGDELKEVGTVSGMDDATRKYFWDWLMKMKEEGFADIEDRKISLNEPYFIWGCKSNEMKIVEFIAQEATKKRYRHPRYVQERVDKNYFECTFNH